MTTTDSKDGGDAGAKQRGQDTASTAKDEGQHVAEVAKEQASQVASEAATQAKNVVNDAVTQVSGQLREQGGVQRDNLVATLSTLGDDFAAMADRASPGLANDLTRQVADQTRSLTSQLDGREPSELLEEVRRFARRRPGVFLLGSLVAGVVAGRLLAGARDSIAGAAAMESTTGTTDTATLADPQSEDTLSATGPLAGQTGTFTNNPELGVTTPGQPIQQADYVDDPETGSSGGGLSSGGRP